MYVKNVKDNKVYVFDSYCHNGLMAKIVDTTSNVVLTVNSEFLIPCNEDGSLLSDSYIYVTYTPNPLTSVTFYTDPYGIDFDTDDANDGDLNLVSTEISKAFFDKGYNDGILDLYDVDGVILVNTDDNNYHTIMVPEQCDLYLHQHVDDDPDFVSGDLQIEAGDTCTLNLSGCYNRKDVNILTGNKCVIDLHNEIGRGKCNITVGDECVIIIRGRHNNLNIKAGKHCTVLTDYDCTNEHFGRIKADKGLLLGLKAPFSVIHSPHACGYIDDDTELFCDTCAVSLEQLGSVSVKKAGAVLCNNWNTQQERPLVIKKLSAGEKLIRTDKGINIKTVEYAEVSINGETYFVDDATLSSIKEMLK